MLDLALLRQIIAATGIADYAVLGARIGASEKSIYKWMNGTSQPAARHLYQLLILAGWIEVKRPTSSCGGNRGPR
jgi:hypothetical protein